MFRPKIIRPLTVITTVVVALLVFALAQRTLASTNAATPPQTIHYQGQLLDTSGNPPAPGSRFDMTFQLFVAETGGTARWSEVHHQTPIDEDGHFNVVLGTLSGGLGNLFASQSTLWLEITVGNEKLVPRQRLHSVGYALNAQVAQSAESMSWSKLTDVPAGFADGFDHVRSAGVGLALFQNTLAIDPPYRLPQTCFDGQLARWHDPTDVWLCQDYPPTYTIGTGLLLNGSQINVTYDGSLTLNGAKIAVNFAGDGTANSAARSDHVHTGETWSTTGSPLHIVNSIQHAFQGTANGSNSSAFHGETNSGGAGPVIHGVAKSSTGQTIGVRGETQSSGDGAAGVFGYASATGGMVYGLYGQSDSTKGFGVYSKGDAYVDGDFSVTGDVAIDGDLTLNHGLEVTGSLRVNGTPLSGAFEYSVPAAAFHPRDTKADHINTGSLLYASRGNEGCLGAAPEKFFAIAPVNLPDNAKVTAVQVTMYNIVGGKITGAGTNCSTLGFAQLVRTDYAGSDVSLTSNLFVPAVGQSITGQVYASASSNALPSAADIDNDKYGYYLEIRMPYVAGETLGAIAGVVIEYELAAP